MDISLLNQAISYLRYQKTAELFHAMTDMCYAVIKGEPLSVWAYGKEGARISGDIDLLVPRKNIQLLEGLLSQNGFSNTNHSRTERIFYLSLSHQTSPWSKIILDNGKTQIGMQIDINFDVFWGEYKGRRIDMENFLSDTVEMNIYGFNIKTLPPLKAMIQLILHHYKEMNSIYLIASHKCINYNMFRDVYYLWKNQQESISLDKLYVSALEYEIVPYVFYVLYFTNQIYKDIELEEYVSAFCTSDGLNLLDYYGLSDKERKAWKVDFWTRLESDNIFELIKNDMTDADYEKLKQNQRIFGQ